MSESPHRIRRERWVVRTGSQEEAFEIRRLLNDGWQDVSPVFEKAFDAINVGTNVVRIPKLEIHLTVDSVEQLATALPDLILERLRHELRSIEVPPSRESSQRHFSKKITENEDRLEALVTYLRTGALPWRLKSTDSAAVSRMLAQTASGERARLRGRLLDLDARDTAMALFRWLHLTSFDEWPLVSETVLASQRPGIRTTVGAVLSLLAKRAFHINGHERLRLAAMLLSVSTNKSEQDVHALAHQILAGINTDEDVLTETEARPLTDFVEPDSSTEERVESEAGFSLGVSHAGLILLHPYFSRFFESLGVKHRGENRLEPALLSRAAALLNFLATGRAEVFEFELGLIKVLLGLRPETPLPVSAGLLSQVDQEEADALLTAVITHWSALKNTSVHGLRASFLQRQGLLTEDEQGWRLQVESRAFDALLKYLPWTVSTVPLPWATKPIYTDWRTP